MASGLNPFPKGSTEAAMWDIENSVNDFSETEYEWLNDLILDEINHTPFQQETGLTNIQTNQELNDMELLALKDLEEQSREGLTARDKAELAKIESQINRANQGRQGAIRQNMASRGLGGSGLDFSMQQQAAQDAHEMAALAGLERAAMSQEGKRSATSRMGAMAGNMSEREFNQKARKAEAQDVINRFNTGNTIDTNRYNVGTRNQAALYNNQGRQGTSDNNVRHAGDVMSAKTGLAELQYNAAVDAKNRAEERKRLERERKARRAGAITGAVGAGVGAVYGGPTGAIAGYGVGSGLGNAFYAEGGKVPGEALYPGDDIRNDTVNVNVSPDEVIIPRSISDDPDAAAEFVEDVNGKGGGSNEAEKAIEGLLAAMNFLSKKRR